MSTDRFNQRSDEPYGSCKDCEAVFETRDEMSIHLNSTFEQGGRINGQGHTARVTNQSRAERIGTHVAFAIQDAIYEFLDAIERDIDRDDLTAAEVQEALRSHPDFYEAWQERGTD